MTAPTADSARANAIAEAFGLGQVHGPMLRIARGAMGEVFRVETECGRFAVKRLFDGPTGDELANADFQFAAARAGVPLALPVLGVDDGVVACVDDGWWRTYEWVDGTHVPNEDVAPVGAAIEVARSLGRLHALRYTVDEEVDGWFLGATADEVLAALDIAERCGVDVTGARRSMPALAEVSLLRPSAPTIVCHNDPDRPNVLVRPEGSIVLIDWDNAAPCYPDGEFAGALWHWAVEGNTSNQSESIASMTRSYREAGGDFSSPGLNVFSTMCSSWLNYAINCCRHLVDADMSSETLEFEKPLLAALATYPVTVNTLEAILDAVPA